MRIAEIETATANCDHGADALWYPTWSLPRAFSSQSFLDGALEPRRFRLPNCWVWLWSSASPNSPNGRSIWAHTLCPAVVRRSINASMRLLISSSDKFRLATDRQPFRVQGRLKIDAQSIVGRRSVQPFPQCVVLTQQLVSLLLYLLSKASAKSCRSSKEQPLRRAFLACALHNRKQTYRWPGQP